MCVVVRCGSNFTRFTPSNFGARSTFNLATHLVLPSRSSLPPSLPPSFVLPCALTSFLPLLPPFLSSYLALALISFFLTVFLAFHSSTQLTAIAEIPRGMYLPRRRVYYLRVGVGKMRRSFSHCAICMQHRGCHFHLVFLIKTDVRLRASDALISCF